MCQPRLSLIITLCVVVLILHSIYVRVAEQKTKEESEARHIAELKAKQKQRFDVAVTDAPIDEVLRALVIGTPYGMKVKLNSFPVDRVTVNLKDVTVIGFGSFSLSYRRPRIGRNPKSGEKVEVPAKWTPHFKAGLELRQRVDKA